MKLDIIPFGQNPTIEDILSAVSGEKGVTLKTRRGGVLFLACSQHLRIDPDGSTSFEGVLWHSNKQRRCKVDGYDAKHRTGGHVEIELTDEEEHRAMLNYPDFS